MVYQQSYPSPLGQICMYSDGTVLTGLWFDRSTDARRHGRLEAAECADLPVFRETVKWLDIYFSGKNPGFTPEYRMEDLTPFRKEVVEIMCRIPYGQVITYNDIAQEITQARQGRRTSPRAVGGAVGWNPICIIVPCHRVVGAGGSLTGYGGGIQNKIRLLELERQDLRRFTVPTKGTAL